MNRKINPLLIFIILISSCKINGSVQGLYSYYKKTNKEHPELCIKVGDSTYYCNNKMIDSIPVVIVNGKVLKSCISNYEKSVVYIWSPKCKSKICPSLDILQQRCDEKNIELFIVAEYYDYKLMSKKYHLKRNIIGIDTKYYKTNLTSKYRSRFIKDLRTVQDTVSTDKKMLFFKKGQLIKSANYIDELG